MTNPTVTSTEELPMTSMPNGAGNVEVQVGASVTPTQELPTSFIPSGATVLSVEQQEHNEKGDVEVEVGASGLSGEEKGYDEKEHKDEHPTFVPKSQAKALTPQQIENLKRKGLINTLKKSVAKVLGKYDTFLVKKDKAELIQIEAELNAVNENTWSDAARDDFSKRISLVEFKAKQLFDDDKKRGKMIDNLVSSLDCEAKGRHDEAELSEAEVKIRRAEVDRKLADAKMIEVLVSQIKTTLKNINEQHKLTPMVETQQKKDMGKQILLWLEEKMGQNHDHLDYNDLISRLIVWNVELIKGTFWDLSPENKGKTKMGRKPVLDFDNVKVERFTFNPSRNSFSIFIQYLRERACDHPQFGNIESKEGLFKQIYRCYLLEYQTTPSKQPPRWLVLALQDGIASAALYVRSDNLYIGGFANQKGQIYELGNADYDPLLKGSIPFGCKCDYPELMNFEGRKRSQRVKNQDVERLKQLDLSKKAVASLVQALSSYDHTRATKKDKEKAQIAIATYAVVFPEVMRFIIVFNAVDGDWLNLKGSHLTDFLIYHMRHWKDISEAIRNDGGGRKFTEKEKKQLGMTCAYEAFPRVHLILNSKGAGFPQENKSKGDDDENESPDGGGEDGSKELPGPGYDNQGKTGHDGKPDEHSKEDGGYDSRTGDDGKAPHNEGTKDHDDDKIAEETVVERQANIMMPTKGGVLMPTGPSSSRFPLVTGLVDILCTEKSTDVVRKGLLASANVLVDLEGPQSNIFETNESSSASKFELCGQRLVEVFCVHTNTPFIKSISIYDNTCGRFLYKPKDEYNAMLNYFKGRDCCRKFHHDERDDSDFMVILVVLILFFSFGNCLYACVFQIFLVTPSRTPQSYTIKN